jgi:hypothetical protein
LLPGLIGSELVGLANLQTATGRSFEDLYRGWSIALARRGFVGKRRDQAGPRTTVLSSEGTLECWDSVATTSRYFVVESSSRGAVDVHVSAPVEAKLQVTAVPLPDNRP